MDLWIRSQDKSGLIKPKNIDIGADNCIYALELGSNYQITLGKYKTKKRAIEVLDEIQKFINYCGSDQVYQMPADDEAK